jgi:hypothetical protein
MMADVAADVAHDLADVIHEHGEQAYRPLALCPLYYPFGHASHSPHALYYVTHRIGQGRGMKIEESGNTRKKRACPASSPCVITRTASCGSDKGQFLNFCSAQLSRIAGIQPSCRLPLMLSTIPLKILQKVTDSVHKNISVGLL